MGKRFGLLAIRLLVSVNLLYAAIFMKFAGVPGAVALFTQMSQAVHGLVSQPVFRLGSGVFETMVAVLFLIPKTARLGARFVIMWMTVIILSHIFVLGYGLFFVDALVLMLLAVSYLLLTRRQSHWGEPESVGGDGCLTNAQKIVGRTVGSGATSPQTRSPHEYVSLWICRKNQSKEKKSWQQQRHPAVPLCLRSRARARFKRYVSPKMAGTLAIREKWLLPTPSIHDGGTARSSSTGEAKLLLSSLASGPKNLTTGSSRKCGHSRETALLYASRTSGTMTRVTGIAPMAMRTGSSMTTDSWRQDMHRSTTTPFWKPIANTTGHSDDVPKVIKD
jgi:chromate transport protein ChrA